MQRLLIDSHVFIWIVGRNPRLPQSVAAIFESQDEPPLLSAVSVAELCIKAGLGRLALPDPVAEDAAHWFRRSLELMEMECLPITLEHGAALRDLPRHHGDPFDRLLIAQAMTEHLTIVTHDHAFALYDGLAVLRA